MALSADHKIDTAKDLVIWGSIGLLSHIAMLPFVAIGIIAARDLRTWKFDLPYLVLLGAIRGIAINYFASKFQLQMKVSPGYKIFNSTLAVPEWFIAISILVDSRRTYQQEFQDLFGKAMTKAKESLAKERILGESASEADETIAKIQFITNSLANDLNSLKNLPVGLRNYSEQAEKIKNVVDKDIKPASATLLSKKSLSVPRISLRALINFSLFDMNLPVIFVAIFSIPYLFVGLIASFDRQTAFIQCATRLLLEALIYFGFETAFRLKRLNRKHTNIGIISSIPVISIFVEIYLVPDRYKIATSILGSLIVEIFLTAAFILLLCTASSYKLINRHRAQVIESLQNYLSNKRIASFFNENISAESEKELANYLHGEIQAGLTASSLLLKKAATEGDEELAQEALERAAGLLNQDYSNISYTRMASPEIKLEKIVDGWKGIADIKLNFPDYQLIEPSSFRNTVMLVEEAISNSIRHSNATKIDISAFVKGEILTINVITNGDRNPKGKSGLGTKLFNELTLEWDLNYDGTQTRLKFLLLNRL